ncbi:MAG: family 20 glycosylhydrolase, partial [Phycisphaerae bacterium]
MPVKRLCWSKQTAPVELHSMLSALAEDYPVVRGKTKDGIQVEFIKSKHPGCSSVSRKSDTATVEYDGISMAARALGTLLSGLESKESTVFKSLGIMLDCSRNAVMTVQHFKKWLRQLALMGYNQAMLYTEDTYKLPDEPHFGYMRGAYTEDELKEIDTYAASLGIEMIACIQTLGHLEQVLRWEPYGTIKDTSTVMLVDGEDTYKLIDKMIALWSRVFGSRRIHIGMDETHDLGRGKFLDKFGYERGFEIFNRHLAKVAEICENHQLKPMIWSDMFFRMGNKDLNYYDQATVIPAEVKAKIP